MTLSFGPAGLATRLALPVPDYDPACAAAALGEALRGQGPAWWEDTARAAWEILAPLAEAWEVGSGPGRLLALRLPDGAGAAPADGRPMLELAFAAAAGGVVMAHLARLEPRFARMGCTPFSRPTAEEAEALGRAGFLVRPDGLPWHAHAVLTRLPFSGCGACDLRVGCPRRARATPPTAPSEAP